MFGLFKKKSKQAEKLSHADYNVIFNNPVVENIPVEVLNIGNLTVPSGKIVVCDPLVTPDMPPLSRTVKPGKYPVKIYIAKTKDSGDRYAIAKLEFSTQTADKWALATRDGEDVLELKEDSDFFGFPVDAGLGGFFDEQAGIAYNKFADEFIKQHPDANMYDDFFEAEFEKSSTGPNDPGNWVNFQIPDTELNITMFQSGYGDGVYPAYWGMTKNDEVVSLVIDFFVLLLPDEPA